MLGISRRKSSADDQGSLNETIAMNIVDMNSASVKRPKELDRLFDRMEASLRSANADLEKSIRLAKTLAPVLNDQSSNKRHLEIITSDASIQEKVIAILMLGFPKNRPILPILQDVLHTGTKALRMASSLAISQMRDGQNNDILCDILMTAYRQEKAVEVKATIRQALQSLANKKA